MSVVKEQLHYFKKEILSSKGGMGPLIRLLVLTVLFTVNSEKDCISLISAFF